MEQPQLQAAGLTLRPWQPSDAARVTEAVQDPQIPRWTTVPSPYSLADARHWLEQVVPAGWADGTSAGWAVCDAGTGQLLASVGLHAMGGADPLLGELGYWAAAPARGRGVVTAASKAVCRWGFETRGLRRIEWYAEPGNEASWRVAHQVGFAFEGRARSKLHQRTDATVRTDGWSAALLPGDIAGARVALPFGSTLPELTDGPVALRRWMPADTAAYADLAAEPAVARWRFGPSMPAYERIAVRAVEGWMLGRVAELAICLDGEPVGDLLLRPQHQLRGGSLAGPATVGWSVGVRAEGHGVAQRAVRLLSRWALARPEQGGLGLSCLQAGVHTGNTRSLALAERLGWHRDGVLRGAAPGHDGEPADEVVFSLLPGDLPADLPGGRPGLRPSPLGGTGTSPVGSR